MINYLDALFFLAISVVGAAVFSVVIILIMDIGAKKKTYYKIENNDTYVVYKWFRGRVKGYYKTYKFKIDRNNLIFLKENITISKLITTLLPHMTILGVFFIISVIRARLLTGIGVLFYGVLVFAEFAFITHKHNVLYCRKFLIRKLKR